MARTIGSISTETLVTVPVRSDYVMTAKGHRYVFLCHIQPRLYDAARKEHGNRRLYDNFVRASRHGLYNISRVYGLDAIDIDDPQSMVVSVQLKFRLISKDDDDECELKEIKKPAPQGAGISGQNI